MHVRRGLARGAGNHEVRLPDLPVPAYLRDQVAQLRGRLGAFQKFTIGSTVNALGVAFENAAAAESAIRDTDFAEETSKLTRAPRIRRRPPELVSGATAPADCSTRPNWLYSVGANSTALLAVATPST